MNCRSTGMLQGLLVVAMLSFVVYAQEPAPEKGKSVPIPGKMADIPMVERLLAARREYQTTLESLRKHYIKIGDHERAKLAEEELMQYHLMVKQVYRLELDVPPPTLKGTQAIPEANAYFREAMKYRDKGVGQQYTLNQRRAELLFQRILTEHPTSDKISDSAYQLATIYESRANNQYARAAVYYERCFQWNPITHHDARIRAARLYDRQLNNRTKASEIYQDIIAKETNNETVREEARRRMAEFGMRK